MNIFQKNPLTVENAEIVQMREDLKESKKEIERLRDLRNFDSNRLERYFSNLKDTAFEFRGRIAVLESKLENTETNKDLEQLIEENKSLRIKNEGLHKTVKEYIVKGDYLECRNRQLIVEVEHLKKDLSQDFDVIKELEEHNQHLHKLLKEE